ncbi:MAG: XRE family transcriptional regulator [Armatimonadetes bacterium]|nr:XRE family transcriptional regulator [Armatimonadota bacterium]
MARGAPRLRTSDGKVNQIGSRVRQRRTELKLTQDALCARLALATDGAWNADRMEIYRIEIGTRIVSDLELLALSRALKCAPYWLLLGEESSSA